MINLIPKEEKKKMTTDFRYRLALLFFLVLDCSLVVAAVSLIPSYFLASAKVAVSDAQTESQKALPLPPGGEQSLSLVKDLNNKLGLVENSEKNNFSVSLSVVNAVLLKKTSAVKVTGIAYTNDQTAGKKITITGTAPSREVLLLFRKALEDSPNFSAVDLPISNFVKGSNIQFYMHITPA